MSITFSDGSFSAQVMPDGCKHICHIAGGGTRRAVGVYAGKYGVIAKKGMEHHHHLCEMKAQPSY
ncbi:hypothetical protein RA996_16535, partial [Mycobacteroides abscessus subsp. abscessus]